ALRRWSPLDVCVVIDDVHRIPPGSSSAGFLADLVRQLPANGHVVLAGRVPPPVPLASLRLGDDLVELTEADLAFTAEEAERLARRLGRAPSAAARFGGWPALVRLALAVRGDVALGYAREEVLAALAPADRRALLALACAG